MPRHAIDTLRHDADDIERHLPYTYVATDVYFIIMLLILPLRFCRFHIFSLPGAGVYATPCRCFD